MEFKNDNEKLNYIESQFATDPCVNIIPKERFEERVSKVFEILWERLSKSFGPGGAATFISIYPAYYATKDGFTMMKNIAFDVKLDQVISNMVQTVCNRLNFTVGDGTTTAVIATKSTYDSYVSNRYFFENESILPRQILAQFEEYKKEILEKLDSRSRSIQSDDPKLLKENIRKIVSVSSNGNEEITNIISSLYEELGYPAISRSISKDGITRSYITEGYKIDTCLTDKLYINNDNNTMSLSASDILIFDHKVTQETYEMILKPISEMSENRQRHLICIAPYYDEKALSGVIKTDLNRQYKTKNDISLVLMVCSKVSGMEKVRLDDLAMLLNTMVITSDIEKTLISKIKSISSERICSYPYNRVFNMDFREIDDMCVLVNGNDHNIMRCYYKNTEMSNIWDYDAEVLTEGFRIGYCESCVLGLEESTFSGFHYDQSKYDVYINVAKTELEEIRRKCENVGAFSVQLTEKQQRLYSLELKTGVIEVGSTSELSQGYLSDTVDDSIKAAASAFNNGIVLGCNVTLIDIINDMIDKYNTSDIGSDKMKCKLLEILRDGYINVYMTVLNNVIPDDVVCPSNDVSPLSWIYDMSLFSDYKQVNLTDAYNIFIDKLSRHYVMLGITREMIIKNIPEEFFTEYLSDDYFSEVRHINDVIIELSIKSKNVFDVTTAQFSHDIINSTETDKEILKATIDLLSLLITGNQLILR